MKHIRTVKKMPHGYWPAGLPVTDKSKLSGAKAAGYRFQDRAVRQLLREFPRADWDLSNEPWFQYWSANEKRLRHAQLDFLACSPEWAVIFEMKLNYRPSRTEKLLELYVPLVQATCVTPVVPVLMTHCIRSWQGPVYFSVADILKAQLSAPASFYMYLLP